MKFFNMCLFIILFFSLENPHGVVANVLDCDIAVSEFELQPRYYIHFRTYTLGKDTPLIFPAIG